MTTDPFNSANKVSVIFISAELVGNLGMLNSADRATYFNAASNNLRSLCLLLGWSLTDLLQEAEQRGTARSNLTGTLQLGSVLCRLFSIANQRQLTDEEVITARQALADLWIEIQPKTET